ncbi:MAG: hypothetical protein ACUVUC_04020 [Thermoguttaceae bacterium]
MKTLSVTHLLVSLAGVGFLLRFISAGRRSLLALSLLGFLVFGSVGLAVAPYVPLYRIPYVESDQDFPINDIDLPTYWRQVRAHWLFLAMVGGFLLVEKRWPLPRGAEPSYRPQRLRCWALGIFLVGTVFYLRYFVFGPGMEFLLNTRIAFSTTGEAILHRSQRRDELALRQGAYMASLAAYILFPVAALLVLRSRAGLRHAAWLGCLIFSGAYAVQTCQKAPVLAAVLSYALLLAADLSGTPRPERTPNERTLALLAATVALVGCVALYRVNFGLGVGQAVRSSLYRLFLVPASAETCYFVAFPEALPFRGLHRSFSIALRDSPTDATIYDVAEAAMGKRSSVNASLLAVGWSAAGYWGVAASVLVFAVGLLLVDRLLARADRQIYLMLLALYPQTFIPLLSSGVLGYTGWGGITIPAIALIAARDAQLPAALTARTPQYGPHRRHIGHRRAA